MNCITTIVLASVLSIGAQIAHAADPTDASLRHVKLHFSDVNLNNIDGATSLYRRLRSAAESVCAEEGTRGLGSAHRVRACVSAAISAAVADINQPSLNAYYRAKYGLTIAAVQQASR